MEGFRNIVLPVGESANPQEKEASSQIPKQGLFSSIEFGAGSKTFKGDERGIWMGSDDWNTAPWKVDMQGNTFITASILTEGVGSSFYDASGNLALFIGIGEE